MKRQSPSLATIFMIFTVTCAVASSGPTDVPNMLDPWLPGQIEAGMPAWVSASATAGGTFDLAQLEQVPRFTERLEARVAGRASTAATDVTSQPTEVVFEAARVVHLGVLRTDTLAHLVEASLGIYSGEVVSVTPGLLFGVRPGSVIELAVDHVYRDSPRIAYRKNPLIFVPVGSFIADDARVVATSRRWGTVPNVGDSLVFFALIMPWDTSGRLLEAMSPRALWFSSRRSGLTTAEAGNPKPAVSSLAALEARLSSLTGEPAEQKGEPNP